MPSELIEKTIEKMNEKLGEAGQKPSIALDISGEGRILVDDEGARESQDDADCTISMSGDTFLGLVKGDVNPMTAVMTRKIKISGDMTAAMSLSKLL